MHALALVPFLLLAPQQSQLPAHLRPGVALLQQQKVAEAVAAFDELLRENPEDGQAWYFYGLANHSAGELDEAIRGHLLASLLVGSGHPFWANAAYNLACAYSLQGKREHSLQWLHRARNRGFSNASLLGNDTDLAALREDPRLEALSASLVLAPPVAGGASVESLTGVLPGGTGGVAVSEDGVVYVADFGSQVFRVRPDGAWEVFATGFGKAADCTLDVEGNLLQVDHGAGRVWRVAADGTKSDAGVEGLVAPVGIDTAPDGSLYVTDYRTNSIVHAVGGTSTVVAAGGMLNGPNGIVWAGEHGLFVVNFNDGAVLQLDPESGALRFIAELPGGGNGHVVWSGEALYVTGRKGHRIFRVSPLGEVEALAGSGAQGTVDGDAAASQLSLPNGIALSGDGKSLFVNDNLGGSTGATSIVRRIRLE